MPPPLDCVSNVSIPHTKYFYHMGYSLGWADVILRHAKGKIADNRVYACALLSAHTDTHGTKGKKGTISRMSDQANVKSGSIGGSR